MQVTVKTPTWFKVLLTSYVLYLDQDPAAGEWG